MSQPVTGISHNHSPITVNNKQPVSSGKAQSDFADLLKKAMHGVNNAQKVSNHKTESLANGKIDQLHDVMATAQKASITLETSVQIQRKVIDAYNEIMRMQV